MPIKAGAASRVINNELGTAIQGATVDKTVSRIRDDLEANALYLEGDDATVLLISCDLGLIQPEHNARYREAITEATGVPERSVIITATHTHAAPSVLQTHYAKPVDEDYLGRLGPWLVELAEQAVASARPCQIGWGKGAAHIGYNRRLCWADGTHTMHGDASRPDFIGLEGPDDPAHLALFCRDAQGNLIAVLHSNTSHPTSFYGADFLSADFPGAARGYLRQELGAIPVLFFNGAFGDISPDNKLAPGGETKDQRVARAGHLVAGETLRLLHEAAFVDDPALGHEWEDMEAEVRLPEPELLAESRDHLAAVARGEEEPTWDTMMSHGRNLLQERFGDNPVDSVPVHAVRIGDFALVTQPCELFCHFGLSVKRRSPTPLTAVCGPADGYNGYCPTLEGVIGGGYSGEPLYWTRLAPETGYRIVDVASKLLRSLW
jgi:hypothetical protein